MKLYKFMNGKNHIIELEDALALKMLAKNKTYSAIGFEPKEQEIADHVTVEQNEPETKRAYNRKK